MELRDLGWDDRWAAEFDTLARADVEPGRVAIEFNHIYRLFVRAGDLGASASGRLKHRAERRSEFPAVGDWVAVLKRPGHETGTIVAVLPRRTYFSRRSAGNVTDEQVVAANVDVVFVVMALDGDYNLRRLDRYLLLARESQAQPVILLTKPDLSSDVATQVAQVEARAGGLAVHVLAPKLNQGVEQVAAHLATGRTAALLGSSGVGKSTIINRLAGDERQRTREVRETDSRGRHTTIHRELVVLPGGGLIIDTPGMRELQLWDVGEAVRETFDDIEALAAGCRFGNCRHREEPRCAVKDAVEAGSLSAERLGSYLTLREEMAGLAQQQDERAQLEEKRRSKTTSRPPRPHLKARRPKPGA